MVGAVLRTFFIRSLSGIASHAMRTAIFAAGIIYLIGTRAQPRRVGRGLLLMGSAMVVHGLWDSMLALADDNGVVVSLLLLGITIVSFVVLITVLRWGAHRERGWLHDVLAPEVANGTITDLEIAALAGERARRRKDHKAALKDAPTGSASAARSMSSPRASIWLTTCPRATARTPPPSSTPEQRCSGCGAAEPRADADGDADADADAAQGRQRLSRSGLEEVAQHPDRTARLTALADAIRETSAANARVQPIGSNEARVAGAAAVKQLRVVTSVARIDIYRSGARQDADLRLLDLIKTAEEYVDEFLASMRRNVGTET